jgi:hypothetical protein
LKIEKCEFTVDSFGVYILPLVGFSWNRKRKSIWLGWLWWLCEVILKEDK